MTSGRPFSWIRWFEEIGIEDIALTGADERCEVHPLENRKRAERL